MGQNWVTAVGRRAPKKSASGAVLPEGHQIEHFRILRLLGQGGMGQVYLARDTQLGRKVALKLVRNRASGLLRFFREARTTARFNHPHIVTLYAFGEYMGKPYFALEYLPGETLKERIRARKIDMQECLHIGVAIASATAEAHRHDVLHLDLKPGNVIIGPTGHTKVLDFGLSQPLLEASTDLPKLDENGGEGSPEARASVAGTPAYMAPEQWKREPLGPATDVWALGVILYEMMARQHPFHPGNDTLDSQGVSAFAKLVAGPTPAPIVEGPQPWVRLIAKCLCKDPAQRPSAKDVVRTLEQIRTGALRASPPEEQSPYQGLRAFTSGQARRFFGRDREITEIVERLRVEPVMAIVGATGAGKSSLVRAGVVPRLASQARSVVLEVRPGREPFLALAAAILGRRAPGSEVSGAHPPSPELIRALASELFECPERLSVTLEQVAEADQARVLLFIDGLEELHTLTDDDALQNRFMRAIALAADAPEDPVRVVFTVRDDFLSRLARAGSEVRAVLRRVLLVQVPERDALIQTLTRPLESTGYRFEDQTLIEDMVAAVGDEPSSLPLLQFAAQALWEHRDRTRKLLVRSEYERLGGVSGALVRHADRVLDAMGPDSLRMAKQILLRMVTSDRTRQARTRAELLHGLDEDGPVVLTRLVESRLLVSVRFRELDNPEPALELAHESLILTWTRLRTWLEDHHEELRFLAQVRQAAALWANRGRRDSELWTGSALAEATHLLKEGTVPIPEAVHQFLDASKRHEKRRRLRRRAVVASSIAVLAVAAVGFSVQARFAIKQQRIAESQHAVAQREGAEAALARGHVLEARAKIRSSLETEDSLLGRALWWQLERESLLWKQELRVPPWVVEISPNDDQLAVGTMNGTVLLMDMETGLSHMLQGHPDQSVSAAYTADGRWLATGGNAGHLVLWNVKERSLHKRVRAHSSSLRGLAFTPEGDALVTVDSSGKIKRWRVPDLTLEKVIRDKKTPQYRPGFDLARGMVALPGNDGRIYLVNIDDGKTRVIDAGHDGGAKAVAFSRDGASMASSGADGTVKWWSRDGTLRKELFAGPKEVRTVVFTPDDRRLAFAGWDPVIRVVDLENGRIVQRFPVKDTVVVHYIQYSVDGRRLAMVSGGGRVAVWKTDVERTARPYLGHTKSVEQIAFHPSGQWIFSGGYDNALRRWNVQTGRVDQVVFDRDGPVLALDVNPNGDAVAWGSFALHRFVLEGESKTTVLTESRRHVIRDLEYSRDGTWLAIAWQRQVYVHDLKTRTTRLIGKHTDRVRDVAIHPDGGLIASAAARSDSSIRLWDSATGELKAVLLGHEDGVTSVMFDDRGPYLFSTGRDKTLRRWDLRSGEGEVLMRHDHRLYDVDLSSDQKLMAVASADHAARILNREGQLQAVFDYHHNENNDLRFSPDGRYLVTNSDDKTVRLFDVAAKRPAWWTAARFGTTVVSHEGWRDVVGNTEVPVSAKWQHAVSSARSAARMDDEHVCLTHFDGTLEVWHTSQDRRLSHRAAQSVTELWAEASHCVVRQSDGVWLYRPQGPRQRLVFGEVSAVTTAPNSIYVMDADRRTTKFSLPDLAETPVNIQVPPETTVTALMVDNSGFAVGFRDGTTMMGSNGTRLSNTPVSPVTRLVAGPPGTILVGFQNGTIGLYNLQSGRQLYTERLHGAVVHLAQEGKMMVAASELGDVTTWDLSVFEASYCQVLDLLWAQVPVAWQSGEAMFAPVPTEHACRGH